MSESQSLKKTVASSLVWKLLERGGVQVVQFIVSIVIARLVSPAAYGSVALLTIFISIASVFVQSGLSTALIQKKDADSLDYSSVFYYSFALAFLMYVILFYLSDPIAFFYEMPELKTVLRVMSLTLFPGALNSVQVAYLSNNMQFKKQFYSGLVAAIISGSLGITVAAIGGGVWALVCQQLSYQILVCAILWFTVKWRPILKFSFHKTKVLLKFGIKLLLANLIDTIYHNIENLIIGKKYSETILAFFSKGKQFPLILIDTVNGSIQSVILPAYSKSQDNIKQVKSMLRRSMSITTYLVFPAMIGLAVVGQPLIQLVLGTAWADCVPFLQIYCIITMLFPLQTVNLQAINALGKSDIYLKLMTYKRTVGIIVLIFSVIFFESVFAIAIACLITEIFSIIINIIPNKKLLGYSFWELLADTLPNLFIALTMGLITFSIIKLEFTSFTILVLQFFVGVLSYVILSIVTKNKNCKYILDLIKRK